MIPAFDDAGYLPFGLHHCEVDDIVMRFGRGSPEREVQTQELLEFIEWARRAGVVRMVVNGSYATSKVDPNDVDIVILPGTDYPRNQPTWSDVQSTWPFLQVFVAADERDLEEWSLRDFGSDRNQRPKGVLEVSL